MAKDVTGNPWLFDAATQGEGFGPNKDSISVVFTTKPYIDRIKVDTGDGGNVLIRSRSAAGTGDHSRIDILKADSTPANDTLEWPIKHRVDGIYIVTLPANATIKVWHGYADEL
jgi:hypothetical protein